MHQLPTTRLLYLPAKYQITEALTQGPVTIPPAGTWSKEGNEWAELLDWCVTGLVSIAEEPRFSIHYINHLYVRHWVTHRRLSVIEASSVVLNAAKPLYCWLL